MGRLAVTKKAMHRANKRTTEPGEQKMRLRPLAGSELAGKVAIITGGGRGIGAAIASAFARLGAKLVLVARTSSELERVAGNIERLGSEAIIAAADVSNAKEVDRIVGAAIETFGRLDVLVNAAAIHGPIGRMWEADSEQWIGALRVNLIGTFLCCRAVIPHMITRGGGKIINFSGGGATSPSPCLSAYGASKAAVVRLTETLAAELRDFNIQINAIAPGMVDTHIHDDVVVAGERAGEHLQEVLQLRESGGAVPAELPAELAVFLASCRSDGLSGKLIAAPHDDWQHWDDRRIAELASTSWFTLRRMDEFTLKPFLEPQTAVGVDG
jgi:NAD(P)-dependent dehydrogenase (short-subunit alcohol dehydrogenase family)